MSKHPLTSLLGATALIAALAPPALATSGLVPPIRIHDTDSPWEIAIEVDLDRVASIEATGRTYTRGVQIGSVVLPVTLAQVGRTVERRPRLSVDLDRSALSELGDGVHVHRIVVDSLPLDADGAPYRAQRALYVRIDGGEIERIGMREYSRIADPVYLERGADGLERPVHPGGAVLDGPGGNRQAGRLAGSQDVRLDEPTVGPALGTDLTELDEN